MSSIEASAPAPWRSELLVITTLAIPTIVQTASQQLMLTTDQIFLGHLGTTELAAAALGLTFSNIQLFFLIGASTALDTLGAQAYGADNHAALVAISFTSAVVLSLLCAPIAISLWFGSAAARTIFGQPENIAHLVGVYCRGLIPGLLPMMLSIVLMKYLQAQSKVIAPAVATSLTFFINIGCNVLFIRWYGFDGSALATSFSRFCQFVIVSISVLLFEAQRSRCIERAAAEGGATPLLAAEVSAPSVGGTMCYAESQKNIQEEEAEDERSCLLQGGSSSMGGGEDQATLNGGREGPVRSLSSRGLNAMRRQLSWFVQSSSTALNRITNEDSMQSPAEASEGQSGGVTICQTEAKSGTSEGMLQYISRTARLVGKHSRAALHPRLLARFAKLAIPGGAMMMFEAGSFEVTTIMASRLGPAVTAAHSCMLAIIVLTYFSCPFALGIAASIRVGNLMGAGDIKRAKLASKLCVTISSVMMAIAALVILLTRHHIGKIFTDDPEVIAIMASIAPMAALFQVSDGIWGTAQGVLRGCGRQHELLVFTLLGFWLVGETLAFCLAFPAGLGVEGIWWGVSAGDTVTMILGIFAMSRIRWGEEVEKARLAVLSLTNDQKRRASVDSNPGLNSDSNAGFVLDGGALGKDGGLARDLEMSAGDGSPSGQSPGSTYGTPGSTYGTPGSTYGTPGNTYGTGREEGGSPCQQAILAVGVLGRVSEEGQWGMAVPGQHAGLEKTVPRTDV